MKCPRCQHENRPGAKFCEECAAPLARACANCGAQLSATAKFCSECAHPAGPAAPPAPQRFGAPETYTPKHLAERIINSKAALEGERKQVTVLFADLKGSMELLADRDPEEARKILDPVLELMMEAVHHYEGTVNQVMGDGIMALFGAPVAHEDHAIRACYAALRMQESVKRYSEEVRRVEDIPIRIRVGLNSGEVVVRSIGSDLHMDYTAVGQTTHLAARMEQLAAPGTIRLTADTLRLAEGYVEVKPLGPVPVKGLSAPVEVYEATGAGVVRSRLQAATARGLTPFVGRDAEVEQLHKALERSGAGRGQLVATVGDPGVGKSRLFHELTHSHRVQDWLILQSGSASYGRATSYLPVIDLLKGYFKVHERESYREIREKVTGKLLTLDRALEPSLPALLALLDVPVDDASWQALDPAHRRQRTLDAVKHLLLRESQGQPLLVVFEDLHWIDSETQALLDSLVESVPTARMLLLVNYRPEYEHRWVGKTYYKQLRLDPLPRESAEELLQALLGSDLSLIPLARLLIDRTQGNPFFLEESVRTLAETGVLAGERGAYRLAKRLDDTRVPATVQAVLGARIDRLPPEEKALLQTASVIGKDVPFTLLQAIADEPEVDLHRHLAHLRAAEFLYETALFPDPEYTFKHALTHEVAYGSLVQGRRQALHAAIVQAMERLYVGRLDEHVERLAHHAFRGELWEKVARYCRQAGTKATDLSAYDQTVVHTDRGLEALTHLSESRQTLELELDLRTIGGRGPGLFSTGQRERLLDDNRRALALAERLGDRQRVALMTSAIGNALWFSGEHTRALEMCRRASEMAEALGDPGLQIVSNLDVGQILRSVGDYRGAVAVLTKGLALLQGALARSRLGRALYPSVTTRYNLASCLSELGQFNQAEAVAQESLRVAEDLGQLGSTLQAQLNVCFVLGRQGRFSEAIPRLESWIAVASTPAFPFLYPSTAGALGHAYAMTGRYVDASPLLEAVERAGRGGRVNEAQVICYLAEALDRVGRRDDASAAATRALGLARERGERGNEARALYLLGEIRSHAGSSAATASEAESTPCSSGQVDPDGSDAHYRQALALAEPRGMRPVIAHCHLGLGKLFRRVGKRQEAHEHLTTATTMYREMGMTYWLAKAEAEMTEPGR
jgi:class 3 adenylate cyclase/tetratricopeptide (TPR) repeat protein